MSFLPVSEALLRLEVRGPAREPAARRHSGAHSVAGRRARPLSRSRNPRDAGRAAVRRGGVEGRARSSAGDGRARRPAVAADEPQRRTSRSTTSSTPHRRSAPAVPCCRPPSNRPARCRPRGSVCFRGRRACARPGGIGIWRRHSRPARRAGRGRHAQHVRWSRHEALERLQPYFRDPQGRRPDVLPERRSGLFH